MAYSLSTNALQSLLEFPFKQPRAAEKLVIGAAITLLGFAIPILPGLAVAGYHAAIARRVIRTGELVMPEWDDWSGFLLDGLKVAGVTLVFMAPAIVTFMIGYGGMMMTSVGAAIVEDGAANEIVPFMPLLLLGSFGGIALFGAGMLLLLAAAALLPPALAHVVATGSFAAGFRVREWWPILRANLSGFLLGYIVLMGVSFVGTFAIQILQFTIILCCLVPLALAAYSMYMGTVGSALFGQVYREGVAKLQAAPAAAPPVPPAPPAPALPAAG
jgi:hypothetical protein